MTIGQPVGPFSADDATLESALQDAHVPSLLPALAYITGDLSLLRDDLKPDTSFLAAEQGGLSPDKQAEARALALAALRAFRDAGGMPCPVPPLADVRRMIDFMTGTHISDDYLPLLLEELAFADKDARAPEWTKARLDPERPFTVAIIGSGMSGIAAAVRLKQAGVPYVIFEKNADVGGTWFENTYPGARVDSSNHVYSYSFAQRPDWPYHFSTQSVLLDYFRECATRFGIREDVRFETEVLAATWHDGRRLWQLRVRTARGAEETFEANAVISAVGQLNRPKLPDIPGMGSFEGPSFHSARWDHSIDLHGKRVAVLGTGASSSQFIPVVAEQAADLRIFQRTPNWYVPIPNYHEAVPEGLQWLFRHVPHYAQWYRFWLFWASVDGLLEMAKVEEGWEPRDRSVGAANDQLRQMLTEYLQASFADRPDLYEKVLPHYPPASKRIVLDNGIWPATLKRPNVRLVTEKILEITPRGVRTADAEEHPADVIIYGTGFQASRFLTPMKVTGRNGVDLHQQWDGDARAYMGVTIPNFPNFFCLYGPNTNIVVNGSIVYFSECEVQYVMECLRLLLAGHHAAMDCRKDVHDRYNVRIDEGNRKMAWGVSTVNSWYKNDRGRVAQNWPFTMLEYWQQTKHANPADYELIGV
jgi:4-hydroxyacetophenone monooxygenase